MKKILVFAMILCTLLLALTGCSKEAEPEATEAPVATEAPAEEPTRRIDFNHLKFGKDYEIG